LDLRGWKQWEGEDYNEFHDLYTSPNIIRVTKSRRIICARHVACMGDMRNEYKILVGKPKGKRLL
jgi:hypothetical protein